MSRRRVTEENLFDFLLDRAKYDGRSGCLLWTGPKNSNGYGQVSLGLSRELGFKHHAVSVHRLAFRAFTDYDVPEGHQLHHTCGRRNCLSDAQRALRISPRRARFVSGMVASRGPF